MDTEQSFAFDLPALAEVNSSHSNARSLTTRITGRQYTPKSQLNTSRLSYKPRLALSNYSSTNSRKGTHSNQPSWTRPSLHSAKDSTSGMTEVSYVRCTSADIENVLDDVDLEYGDSASSDLYPFGKELKSETIPLEMEESMPCTMFIDELIEDHEHETVAAEARNSLSFVPETNKIDDIASIFREKGVLGSGASCRVLRAQHIATRTDFALKEMSRSVKANSKKFQQEVAVLNLLQHPNIVSIESCYADKDNYYVATEYCSGGTLYDKLNRMKTLSEIKSAGYIRTLLEVAQHMHSLNVVHQDLKLINLVFSKPGLDGILKVIDVGDSMIVDDDKTYYRFAGTRTYMPPEIGRPRTGREMKKGDIWTIGIIAYFLVFGRRPFLMSGMKRSPNDIMRAINARTRHSVVSNECRDFISKCLHIDPAKRLSAEELLEHDWITEMSTAVRKRSIRMSALRPLMTSNGGLGQHSVQYIHHSKQPAQEISMDFDLLDELGVDSILDTVEDEANLPDVMPSFTSNSSTLMTSFSTTTTTTSSATLTSTCYGTSDSVKADTTTSGISISGQSQETVNINGNVE